MPRGTCKHPWDYVTRGTELLTLFPFSLPSHPTSGEGDILEEKQAWWLSVKTEAVKGAWSNRPRSFCAVNGAWSNRLHSFCGRCDSAYLTFLFSVFFFFLFETGSHNAALAGAHCIDPAGLTLLLKKPACLCLLRAGIKGSCDPTPP